VGSSLFSDDVTLLRFLREGQFLQVCITSSVGLQCEYNLSSCLCVYVRVVSHCVYIYQLSVGGK